jgi:Arc/MetJ-type ribon-helix-helix transcriptional regulator
MSANRPRRGPNKKRTGKRKPNISILEGEMISRVRRQIDSRWPNLGRGLVSMVRISREKLDDLYSSAAEVINEHKEAFEDRRAERKAQIRVEARTVHQSDFKALPAPAKVPESGKRAATNGSGLYSARTKSTRI